MSFSPRPCAHCGGTSFHVLPGVQLEPSQVSSVFGLVSSRKLSGVWWTITLVVCTQCGRTETFTNNAAELASHITGSYVASSAGG